MRLTTNYLESKKGLARFVGMLAFLLFFGIYIGQNYAYAQTVTRYVSTTGLNTNPASATSWVTSTTDLQGAINSLTATGGEVWVATGVYRPTGITEPPFSERDNSFSMKEGVAIYGSFKGNETALNQRPVINPGAPGSSTLSGEIGDLNSLTDNSYHVIHNSQGLTNAAILDGFVIANGYANSTSTNTPQFDRNGAGMFNNGYLGVCSPLLRNCLFVNNIATVVGGAMYNYALQGNSSPTLTNCSFLSNSALVTGGAVFNSAFIGNSTPQFTNCSFLGNRASSGGAMNNSISRDGGNANPVLINCVVWDNGTDPIHNGSGPDIVATYCVFDVRVGNYVFSTTNQVVTISPFAGATDLRLAACSPAINAGLNSATGLTGITTDGANNPRVVEGRVDVGAFEFQEPLLLSIIEQPTNGSTVCEGTSVTAIFGVSGTVLSYQWYKAIFSDSEPDIDLGAAQNTSVFSLTNARATDSGTYYVIATGSCNSLTSSTFGLGVEQVIGIARQPAAQSIVCVGSDVTARPRTSGSGNFILEWYRDGTLLLDQTDEMLSLTNVQPSDTGSYSLVITGMCNSTTSNAFNLTVDEPVGKVSLISSGTLTCSNLSVTLTTSGDNANSFTLLNTAQTNTSGEFVVTTPGSYTVRAGNMGACSDITTLTIAVESTIIASDGVSLGAIASGGDFCVGSLVQVAVPVTGGPASFQWYQNGTLLTGQTSATLTLSTVQLAQIGSYVLVATAGCISVSSTAYILTVSTVTPNVVITLPNGSSVTVSGNSPTISLPVGSNVPLLATGGVFYEWLLVLDRVNGYEIRQVDSNATGLFTINRTGPYRLTVRASNGCQRTVEGVIVSR